MPKPQNASTTDASDKSEWRTPRWLFDPLDAEFHFELDAAADANNHLCDRYYTEEQDALKQPWDVTTFCNCPYGHGMGAWTKKALSEHREHGSTIVMLIPASTGTLWWHRDVLEADEIRIVAGRVAFLRPDGSSAIGAGFDSAVVIFRTHPNRPIWGTITQPDEIKPKRRGRK